MMTDAPFSLTLPFPKVIPSKVEAHIKRPLSELRGMFSDEEAFESLLQQDDVVVYEVFEIRRPEAEGELALGVSIVHPGMVGAEFFMTKGHFHSVLDTAEVYVCLQGEGFMVMETPEGDTSVMALRPGTVLYVPPRWAHRSVCTSRQADLVTLFVYPGHAGHDYRTIEQQGFRKLVIDAGNGIEFVNNPRWRREVRSQELDVRNE
jgi:glucose-6-phosphate isomerase, archaeal